MFFVLKTMIFSPAASFLEQATFYFGKIRFVPSVTPYVPNLHSVTPYTVTPFLKRLWKLCIKACTRWQTRVTKRERFWTISRIGSTLFHRRSLGAVFLDEAEGLLEVHY